MLGLAILRQHVSHLRSTEMGWIASAIIGEVVLSRGVVRRQIGKRVLALIHDMLIIPKVTVLFV